jgi:hypothetical protein
MPVDTLTLIGTDDRLNNPCVLPIQNGRGPYAAAQAATGHSLQPRAGARLLEREYRGFRAAARLRRDLTESKNQPFLHPKISRSITPRKTKMSATLNEYGFPIPQQLMLRKSATAP